MTSTYYKPGSWNAWCDRCGRKFKADELRRTWEGLMVCATDWEPRHPQDYVRGAQPEKSVPWTRPGGSSAVAVCTPNGSTAIVDFAVVDCAVVDYVSPFFDPTITY